MKTGERKETRKNMKNEVKTLGPVSSHKVEMTEE
jgi:hypothetical protein